MILTVRLVLGLGFTDFTIRLSSDTHIPKSHLWKKSVRTLTQIWARSSSSRTNRSSCFGSRQIRLAICRSGGSFLSRHQMSLLRSSSRLYG